MDSLLGAYLRERAHPHPILARFLPEAASLLVGAVPLGLWDERSPLEIRLLLPDGLHDRLSTALQDARLWDPARDVRLRVLDREPFRQYPGAELLILSVAQLRLLLEFDLPPELSLLSHAEVLADPAGILSDERDAAARLFRQRLDSLRREHYYRFRQARSDLAPRVTPRRQSTLLAIQRGAAAREALRLAFLAEGLPYPCDRWLEPLAERETRGGGSIVAAARALLAAREPDALDHASKVLRDRVAFALQQGGISEPWLEQWWMAAWEPRGEPGEP